MNDGTETLKARINKHAAEIAALEERHRVEVAIAKASARIWQSLFGAAMCLALIAGIFLLVKRTPPPSNWRADTAPALQRVYVVTEGFVDKNGEWRNLTNGERIEVKHWLMP